MTSLFETIGKNKALLELLAKKNSPQFLFVGGVVGMVGTTVLACRATLKVQDVLEVAEEDNRVNNSIREQHPDHFSEEERRKNAVVIYTRSAGKIVRLYAPAVGLGVVSIAALTKSHNILQERNVALMAAYSALDRGFKEYRSRVIEKYGEDQDREFRYETEVVVEGSGKNKKTTVRIGQGEPSVYAVFYDEYSANWSREPEINKIFLKNKQNYLNDLLRARGHVFLNEVYHELGLPHSKAGAVVGWIMGEAGDNYIDFGVFTPDAEPHIRDFVNGREGSILLDFNVDGVIFDKLPEIKEAIKWRQLEQ